MTRLWRNCPRAPEHGELALDEWPLRNVIDQAPGSSNWGELRKHKFAKQDSLVETLILTIVADVA
jgi:hypothetical protein